MSKIWILINHKVWHPFWSYTSWSSPLLIPFPLAPWRGNWLDSSSKCLGSLWGKVWCAEVSELVLCTLVHCSYLNIYVSRKIRLCLVDLEDQFQTTLQVKGINFSIWKFRYIILIFLLFFAGIVKFSAFCTSLMLFPKGWIF